MATGPNKLSQFWQELKRRKVIRVITVYAASAFVILELVSIIVEPLKLPEWFLSVVIVLLCIGFIIAVILSWIYDIHPEGGIVKTELTHKVKEEDKPATFSGWKIASYISFVVIVGLIAYNIFLGKGGVRSEETLETSVAVLPFENMSSNEEENFLGGAFTDEIIIELQKIKAFDRVLSRTSTMQFDKNRPTIPEIAEKLNVNYIVEGSIQRSQEHVRIRVQVIRAKNEDHVWAEEYDREWKDIFSIQDEIAFHVARELQMTLSPEEKEYIEKIPTTSLTAYDFYQRGREEYTNFLMNVYDNETLQKAQDYYFKALEYDSTFAEAYAGVAKTCYSKLIVSTFTSLVSEAYLDSNGFDTVFKWANKALLFDNQLSEAYVIRGKYFVEIGHRKEAEQDFNRAIKLNPNQWEAYFEIANMYYDIDNLESLEHYRKAASLHRSSELSLILFRIWETLMAAGFREEAESTFNALSELGIDSSTYYLTLYVKEIIWGDRDRGYGFISKAYAFDPTNPITMVHQADMYSYLGDHEKALNLYEKYIDIIRKQGRIPLNHWHRIGYSYYRAGFIEEADSFMDKQEEICIRLIELQRPFSQSYYAYYDLAAVYAFRNETEKALDILRSIIQETPVPMALAKFIRRDAMFSNIGDEPEFQEIVRDMEARYQAEHERVRQWLVENDML